MVLPLDKYTRNHLVAHLAALQRYADISKLVVLPEWYETKVATDISAGTYIQDLVQARLAAQQDTTILNSNGSLAPPAILEVRHTLALSTLRTTVRKLTGAHVNSRLVTGQWGSNDVINLLRLLPDTEASIDTLHHILDRLDQDHVNQAISWASESLTDERKIKALAILAERLAENEKRALISKCVYLTKGLSQTPSRLAAFLALAPRVEGSQLTTLMADFLKGIGDLADDETKATFLILASAHLDRHQIDAALTIIGQLEAEHCCKALIGVAQALTSHERRRGLEMISQLPNSERLQALQELAPFLDDSHGAIAAQIARTGEDNFSRSQALGVIATHLGKMLSRPLFDEAIAEARAIKPGTLGRAEALSTLALNEGLTCMERSGLARESVEDARKINLYLIFEYGFQFFGLLGNLAKLGYGKDAIALVRLTGNSEHDDLVSHTVANLSMEDAQTTLAECEAEERLDKRLITAVRRKLGLSEPDPSPEAEGGWDRERDH